MIDIEAFLAEINRKIDSLIVSESGKTNDRAVLMLAIVKADLESKILDLRESIIEAKKSSSDLTVEFKVFQEATMAHVTTSTTNLKIAIDEACSDIKGLKANDEAQNKQFNELLATLKRFDLNSTKQTELLTTVSTNRWVQIAVVLLAAAATALFQWITK